MRKYEIAVEEGDYTSSIVDLINLTQNLDCYDIVQDIDNDYALGEYYINECGAYLDIPEGLSNYIAYDAYGRDARMNDCGSYINGCYVCETGASFYPFSTGMRFPKNIVSRLFPSRKKWMLCWFASDSPLKKSALKMVWKGLRASLKGRFAHTPCPVKH